jgi:dTDP-4-dehydrorhamnose reductase
MTFLTGGSGQLGTELQKHQIFYAPQKYLFNIINPDRQWLVKNCPQIDAILHCAADTQNNKAQTNLNQAVSATMTNVLGTANMVQLANDLDIPIFHISTETCIDPYNTYAKTKLLAEEMVRFAKKYVIIRTSFRDNPFEYPKAPTDMWTIGDDIEVIAKLIIKRLSYKHTNKLEYIGTPAKIMFELAQKTRPDVEPTTIEELNKTCPFQMHTMEKLKEVKCWSS